MLVLDDPTPPATEADFHKVAAVPGDGRRARVEHFQKERESDRMLDLEKSRGD